MAEGSIGRLVRRVTERGVSTTLAKAFGDHVFRHSESVILEADPRVMRAGTNLGCAADIGFSTVQTGEPLPPLGPWLAPRRADFEAMLAADKLGVFVLRDGVAVGCIWMALSDHRERAAREFYRVGANEAYLYCYLLDPAERTRGAALPLVRHCTAVLHARGITRQFSVVDRANRASFLIVRHFAGREGGIRVRHFYILGTRWTRMSRYTGTLGPNRAGQRRAAR